MEERAHELGDCRTFFLKGEMAGVEEVEFHVLQVSGVGMRALGRKDRVVAAPDDQRRPLVAAEVGLPFRIPRRVVR